MPHDPKTGDIVASLDAPKDLFANGARYSMPMFQRPYVWKRESQWEPLWEDLQAKADECAAALRRTPESYTEALSTPDHFLGTIVLQEEKRKDLRTREWHVIDGQQRILTLQLLLRAAQECLGDARNHDLMSMTHIRESELRVESTEHDTHNYSEVMNGAEERTKTRFSSAYRYFADQIRAYIHTYSEEEREKIGETALFIAITQKFRMCVIQLALHVNAHDIYESLNARGTALRQTDLIKNFVLSQGVDLAVWKVWETPEWQRLVSSGRHQETYLEAALRRYLIYRTRKDVRSAEIYPTFKKLADGADVVEDLVKEAQKDLKALHEFRYAALPDGPVKTGRDTMSILQMADIWPAVFAILKQDGKTRNLGMLMLASYMIRRKLAYRSNRLNSREVVIGLVKMLRGATSTPLADMRVFLAGLEGTLAWPTDHETESRLVQDNLTVRRPVRQFLLQAIESRMRSIKEEPVETSGLTLEHIMPTKWVDHWPLPANTRDVDRELAVNKIGNLTLVTRAFNSSAKNLDWATKRAEMERHSSLRLNKSLIYLPEWNETTIDDRSRSLAREICKIWPGPNSPIWKDTPLI